MVGELYRGRSVPYRGKRLDFLGFPVHAVDEFGVVWASRVDRSNSRYRRWVRLRGTVLNKGIKGKKTYRRYNLKHSDGTIKSVLGHVLVLEAFVGPRPLGMEACHDDNDGLNNALENLRWDTPVNNQRDRFKHGTRTMCITTEEVVKKIRREYRRRVMGYKKLGDKYGLHFVTVAHIVNRRTWKHVK